MARIREKSGHLNSSLATLKEARDNQYRLQNRIAIEQSSGFHEQNLILSKFVQMTFVNCCFVILQFYTNLFLLIFYRICILLAEHSISLRDNHQAISHYKEALKHLPDDVKIMTSLERLYMQVNNGMECQTICSKILKIEPNNEAASVMMADLSFHGVRFV